MLAVGKDIDYAIMQEGETKYVMAKALLPKFKKQLENATEVGVVKGEELIGLSYTPMFPYFAKYKEEGAFKRNNFV